MIYNLSFKLIKEKEIIEEGFETIDAPDIECAFYNISSVLSIPTDCNKIELTLNVLDL